MYRIESLLAARQFLSPQAVGDRLFFISNLSGKLSLYAMDHGGSVPEPLLPPDVTLHNPHLIGGEPFHVFPDLGKVLVMLDNDGDENYQPMVVAIDGGYPEPAFGDRFEDARVHCGHCDAERGLVYLMAESRSEAKNTAWQANLATGEMRSLGSSRWGNYVMGVNRANTMVALGDGYTAGDTVLYLWREGEEGRALLHGVALEDREIGQEVPLTGFGRCSFTPDDEGLVLPTTLHDDSGGLGYIDLGDPGTVHEIAVSGIRHHGVGELVDAEMLTGDLYAVQYNIDGVSWLYEGRLDIAGREMALERVLVGWDPLDGGVLESVRYDEDAVRHAMSFSTATSPTQLYTAEPGAREIAQHTAERVLGIAPELLAPGEDASFSSFDGLRVSARLYMPSQELGFDGPRPVVYYIHGGPQSQERPDFAWFSMPLIQLLTLRGFAVFVPNVRGSSGYGLEYMKLVDRDWGGDDRLDHVHAMLEVLPDDPRIDTRRAGVVGRSYGGYMTLTLASRHPELWSAAVDMFGPYDLLTFMDRIPETWKPYFEIAIADPATARDFLVERSPRTYIDNVECPLMVIQGQNDPRVVEAESRDLVEHMRSLGKEVEYLLFEDEGHDVLKIENRVRCYNEITAFFEKHLYP